MPGRRNSMAHKRPTWPGARSGRPSLGSLPPRRGPAQGRAPQPRPALPVLVLLVYRPFDLSRLQAPRVTRLPYFTEIMLGDMLPEEGAELLRLKLAQRASGGSDLPPAVVDQILNRAGGNPFYIEELF